MTLTLDFGLHSSTLSGGKRERRDEEISGIRKSGIEVEVLDIDRAKFGVRC